MSKYKVWTKNKEDGMDGATYDEIEANSELEAIAIKERELDEYTEIVDNWSASSYFDAMNGYY